MVLEAGPHIWVFRGGGTKVTPLNGTLDEGREMGLKTNGRVSTQRAKGSSGPGWEDRTE